jgi:hypothetical protein
MTKHKTAKGKEFNMQAFAAARGTTTAVGNAPRNARGDLIGPGGKIVATAQEIANKYHDGKVAATSSKQVNLNLAEKEVKRREIVGADGVTRTEVTYADGSVEILKNEDNIEKDF